MIQLVDITKDVKFGQNEAEFLPIERCKCGLEFGHWDFFISNDKEDSVRCPGCGRRLVFYATICVCEVVEKDDASVIAANLQVAADPG